MLHKNLVILATVSLIARVAQPNVVEGQVLYRRNTWVPRELVGGNVASTVMQQQCDYTRTDEGQRYSIGQIVQRIVVVNPRLTVLRQDTLTALDTAFTPIAFTDTARATDTSRTGVNGEVYVDAVNPSVLRVRVAGGDKITKAFADNIAHAEPKRCNLFFKVRDDVDLGFRSNGWVGNAITIPFRIRPGYSQDTTRINSEVSTGLAVGLSVAFTRWGTWYKYRDGVTSAVRTTNKLSVGPFFALSSGTADKASTRTSKQRLADGEKAAFVAALPGLAISYNIFGVDVGAFGGTEHVIGSSAARRWDWNNRKWFGFGIGYGLFKWGA